MKLHTKILVGLVAGAAAGVAAHVLESAGLVRLLTLLEPLGTAFIRLITMVVVPLVVASLFVGTSSLGDLRKLGRIGGKTLAYFLVTTVLAATIGLGLALAAAPGRGLDPGVRDALSAEFTEGAAGSSEVAREIPSLVDTLVEMIPRNPFEAAAEMDLLPLIVATVLFGAAAGAIPEHHRSTVVAFFQGVNELSMVIIAWVMRLAPYAVFALIASAIARFGVDLLQSLLYYSVIVAAGLVIHVFGVLHLALRLFARLPLFEFFRRVAEAPLVAFSTSSSNAALPVSMEVAERNLGISNQIVSFVLPVGATLNMNGSALYKAVTAVFVAQVYGVSLGAPEILTIVITATMAAVAGAGVPGSSLVTTLIVLNAIGLGPRAAAGIALVLGVDRILDMLRTTVNVVGDLTGVAVIARSEGEVLAGVAGSNAGTGP